jgi:hypothetical protein
MVMTNPTTVTTTVKSLFARALASKFSFTNTGLQNTLALKLIINLVTQTTTVKRQRNLFAGAIVSKFSFTNTGAQNSLALKRITTDSVTQVLLLHPADTPF